MILVLALALTSCAELQPVTDSAERAIDDVDQALVAVSAAYNAVCAVDGEKPAFCAQARETINRAVRSRNELVSK